MPGSLNRQPQGPLVFGTDSGTAAWFNLGPVGNEPANPVYVFVVDGFHVINAESAYLPAGSISSSGASTAGTSTGPSSGAARPSRRSARSPTKGRIADWAACGRGWGGTWLFCGHISLFPYNIIISCCLERQVVNIVHGPALISHPGAGSVAALFPSHL